MYEQLDDEFPLLTGELLATQRMDWSCRGAHDRSETRKMVTIEDNAFE